MTEALADTDRLKGVGRDFAFHRFSRMTDAVAWVADAIAADLDTAISARGQGLLSGCGGSTPKPVYERLAHAALHWERVTVTEVDERFVPLDDPRSNTLMMTEALKPAIGQGLNFITLTQDISDAASSAKKAEAALRDLNRGEAPIFDVTLLGMGEDAHYASIFPEHSINSTVYDTDTLVLPVAPAAGGIEPKIARLTQSVKQINRSRRVILFIIGEAKRLVLERALLSTDAMHAPIGAYLNQCPAAIDIVWSA